FGLPPRVGADVVHRDRLLAGRYGPGRRLGADASPALRLRRTLQRSRRAGVPPGVPCLRLAVLDAGHRLLRPEDRRGSWLRAARLPAGDSAPAGLPVVGPSLAGAAASRRQTVRPGPPGRRPGPRRRPGGRVAP